MLSVAVDDKFAKAIDDTIKCSGAYSSRSEFMKDSMRRNLEQANKLSEGTKRMREDIRKLSELAKKRGYKGGLISREEKDQIAEEYLKEKGFM